MPDPQLVIIVLHYKNAFLTKECIASILPGMNDQMKLLLVDNGSNDGSPDELTRAFPGIDILTIPQNQGFAGGFNTGIRQALNYGSQKILLVSNDTIFEQDTVVELMEADWDVCVPKILFYDRPNIIWNAGSRWRRFPPGVIMLGFGKEDSQKYNYSQPLDYATGCVFLARREVFETVGGFDPDYKYYMEDYDFFFRVREAGFSVGFVPTARLLHRVSQTLGAWSNETWEHMGRNTVLFYRKSRRFSNTKLWTHLVWVTLREAAKGRFRPVRQYWNGVKLGFAYLKNRAN